MSRTKTELATEVLRRMGVLDALATPAAADANYIMRVYDYKLAEWRDRRAVYWPNTSDTAAEIPPVVFGPLRDLLVSEVGPAFGFPAGNEDMLLKPLYRHAMREPSGLPTKVDQF